MVVSNTRCTTNDKRQRLNFEKQTIKIMGNLH